MAFENLIASQFLEEHPEWSEDYRATSDGDIVFASDAMVAYMNWALERGLGHPQKVAKLRRLIEQCAASTKTKLWWH